MLVQGEQQQQQPTKKRRVLMEDMSWVSKKTAKVPDEKIERIAAIVCRGHFVWLYDDSIMGDRVCHRVLGDAVLSLRRDMENLTARAIKDWIDENEKTIETVINLPIKKSATHVLQWQRDLAKSGRERETLGYVLEVILSAGKGVSVNPILSQETVFRELWNK